MHVDECLDVLCSNRMEGAFHDLFPGWDNGGAAGGSKTGAPLADSTTPPPLAVLQHQNTHMHVDISGGTQDKKAANSIRGEKWQIGKHSPLIV